MVQIKVELDDKEFIEKLSYCLNQNPNIMNTVLQRAKNEFEQIGAQAAFNGPPGLRQVTGKTYKAGFKRYIKSTKKYSSAIFTARIANIFQGQKKGSGLPDIKIMKIAEKAFRKSGALDRILREEMERVYNG